MDKIRTKQIRKISLSKEDIYKGNLLLVNQDYFLHEDLNRKLVKCLDSLDVLLDKEVNKYLQLALKKIKAKGKITFVSGFRLREEQEKIYADSLRESGEEFTKKYVALPGASEHETGLAIDLGLTMDKIDFIRPLFPHMGICEEFRKVASQYGFIERYKKDKEKITKINAEEWHFRYVGYPHAKIIEQNNFCLEEYIEFLKKGKFSFDEYEIEYIPYENKKLVIELGKDDTISGNNCDGYIVTRKVK